VRGRGCGFCKRCSAIAHGGWSGLQEWACCTAWHCSMNS
jgi:hypothetical protein